MHKRPPSADELQQLSEADGRGWVGPRPGETADDGPVAPEFSDEALALRFAAVFQHRLRYVAAWNKWMVWDGHVWRPDETLNALHLARMICREAAASCNHIKVAKALVSAKTEMAALSLARADRRLAAVVDQWDADLWLLNTPGGVLDLRTGDLCEHDPELYMTKMTAVAPEGRPLLWLKFLAEITNRDPALQQFLKRIAGYALTGLTNEHALFFLYGTGGNGKGVFLSTLAAILADYHRAAPIETFTESHTDRHPTELANLRGARLVTAIETEEGRRWAEAKIKALTGGDRIPARFMRQDFFEYTPQFKLLIAGNHKPSLRSVDESIRRRFHLVPFVVTIPPDQRDRDLAEKLKEEWPAVLQWMADGCIDWQESGLAPPEAVTAATDAYLNAQDATGAWIEECCEINPNAWERTADLFASWRDYAERNGEFVGDQRQFRDRLEGKGILHRKEPGTGRAGYQGMKLRQSSTTSYWQR
jgi:putative DNA primase/helicase